MVEPAGKQNDNLSQNMLIMFQYVGLVVGVACLLKKTVHMA